MLYVDVMHVTVHLSVQGNVSAWRMHTRDTAYVFPWRSRRESMIAPGVRARLFMSAFALVQPGMSPCRTTIGTGCRGSSWRGSIEDPGFVPHPFTGEHD